MNTSNTPTETRILVWDWPVRIGHWLMVGGFIIAWITGESENWRLVHAVSGSLVLAIALYRLVWGFIGSPTARFAAFVRGPQAVRRYLASLIKRQPEHHSGHNPAGGWAIVLLLGFALLAGATGWLTYNDLGGDALAEVHEALTGLMFTLVLIHLAGVLISSLLHKENLVRAMLSGYKRGLPKEALSSARPLAAVVLLVWLCIGVVWFSR